LSRSAVARVYRINDHAVLKCPWNMEKDVNFRHEKELFDMLGKYPPCCDISDE